MNELLQRYLNYLNLAAVPVVTQGGGIEYSLRPVSSLGGGDNVSSFGSAPVSSEQSAVNAGYGTITAKNPVSETRQAISNVVGMVPGIGGLLSLAVNPNRIGEIASMFGIVGPGMTVASEFGPTPASVGAVQAGYGFPGDMFGEFGPTMSSYSEAATDNSGVSSAQSASDAGFGSDPSGEGGGTSDAGGSSSSGGGDTGSDGSFAEGGIVNLLNYYYGKR